MDRAKDLPGKDARRILLVDDEDDLREIVGIMLEQEGYRVLEARDGREALDRLGENQDVAMIILDLVMPGMNGREFLEEQRRRPALAGIPVVVMSAGSDFEDLSAPVVASLRKPAPMKTFLDVIQRHL